MSKPKPKKMFYKTSLPYTEALKLRECKKTLHQDNTFTLFYQETGEDKYE